MSDVKVLLVRTAGTNCDKELDHAFTLAGASVTTLHINVLLENPAQFAEYQILGFPGGFSYGDDIASGKILANQIIHHLKPALRQFVDDGKMIFGVCNGFQILVKCGLLPGPMAQLAAEDWHPTTLTYNTSGKFEDRWVRIKAVSSICKWIKAGTVMDVPIAHGEGRFVARDAVVLEALKANDLVAFRYVDEANVDATEYPANPNGSLEAIAGICDVTGRVLGLMPHPERVTEAMNHPQFTRGRGTADGLILFQNAVQYVHTQMAVVV